MPRIDRRVARTREGLHRALMALIHERGYEPVTVADICGAANVGRSTFYAHFAGKDDLRQYGVGHMRKAILDRHREASGAGDDALDRPFGFSLVLLEQLRDHFHRHPALACGETGGIVMETFRRTLCDLVREEFAAANDRDSAGAVPSDLAVHYVVGGFMAVLTWWLDGGAKLPAEEIERMLRRLATEGVVRSRSPGATGS